MVQTRVSTLADWQMTEIRPSSMKILLPGFTTVVMFLQSTQMVAAVPRSWYAGSVVSLMVSPFLSSTSAEPPQIEMKIDVEEFVSQEPHKLLPYKNQFVSRGNSIILIVKSSTQNCLQQKFNVIFRHQNDSQVCQQFQGIINIFGKKIKYLHLPRARS